MTSSIDSKSPAANGRVEVKRSVLSIVLSVLATGSAMFGAGAALASPSSMSLGDGLLAFHVA